MKEFKALLYIECTFAQSSEIFTHQFDRKKMSGIQGVRCQFFKSQNPDQSCRPSIDLTMVLKQKSDKEFKKVATKRGNPSYNS